MRAYLGIGREVEHLAAGHRTISLWVYTDDCEAAIERLRGAGMTITQERADQP